MKIIKRLRSILPVALILVALVTPLLPAQPVLAADAVGAELYQHYCFGEDNKSWCSSNRMSAQSFTPAINMTITSARVRLYEFGSLSAGSLQAVIKATDGSGYPTGTALCSGEIAGAHWITDDEDGAWYKVRLGDGAALTSGIKYALVLSSLDETSYNKVAWMRDSSAPTYTEGCSIYSTDSGASWTNDANSDFMFEIWGTGAAPPAAAPIVVNPDGASFVEATTARLDGVLHSRGFADTTVHIYWGDEDGGTTAESWDYDVNLGVLPEGSFYKDIDSLTPDTTHYYRCYATNSAGTDWADATKSFVPAETADPNYPRTNTDVVSGVTSTSATFDGKLTSLGTGATSCDVKFQWDYADVDTWTYATTLENMTSTGTFTANINIPVGGRTYKVRTYTRNNLANIRYGEVVEFEAPGFPVTIAENNYVHYLGVITHVFQRKAFFAAGRHWIIYCKGTNDALPPPTGGFYYRSSSDGLQWTTERLFIEAENDAPNMYGVNEADELNVFFDGNYVHTVYVWNRNLPETSFNNIYYRRGTPQTDGTIDWASDWVVAVARSDDQVRGYASIVCDTNGYPWIDYFESGPPYTSGLLKGTGSGLWHRWIVRSSTKDGTFTMADGYPMKLKDSIGHMATGALVQLPEGKLYWIGCSGQVGGYLVGRLYNGSAWEDEVQIANDASGRYRFSAVTQDETVYLIYMSPSEPFPALNIPESIKFTKRLEGGWTTPQTLVSGLDLDNAHQWNMASLSINNSNGDLYVFYVDYETEHIKYLIYNNVAGSWGSPIDWIDESHSQLAASKLSTYIGSAECIHGGKLGVYYVTMYPDWVLDEYGSFAEADLRFCGLEVEGGPQVRTDAASSIEQTTAMLNGYVADDGGETCSVRFQWGAWTTYGTNTEWQGGKTTTDSFNQGITGLTPNTLYHYRAQIKWADETTSSGEDKTFVTTATGIPSVTTAPAVGVTTTAAVLQGSLDGLGSYSPVYVYFEYGTTTAYGASGSPTGEQTKTVAGGFNQAITGLNPNTLYHFRAVVRYNNSYIYGNDTTFTTSVLDLPTITTNDASGVSQTTAALHGTLNSLGSYVPVYVNFEYGTTTSYGSTTVDQSRSAPGSFQASVSELNAGTTYHFRARAKYNGWYAYGNDNTFTTPAVGAPVISTGSATSISNTNATLQGNLTSLGDYTPVYVYFQYGATTSYGITTSQQSKAATCTFSQTVTGLAPNNTYHFRAVVKYDSNYIYGIDATFTTTEEAIPGEPGIDPPDIFRIDDVKVFSGYFESNDQLYVIAYRIIYSAGMPILDVGDYFDFQLLDGAVLKAQVPVKAWDYKPGSIYLSALSAPTPEGDYTIKIIGNPSKWETPPECYRDITPGDWQGADLTQLDTWVISLASSLQSYYNSEMVIYTTGGQAVLSKQGGAIFNMSIPGLSTVRPNLFSATSEYIHPDWEEHPREYEGTLNPKEHMGSYFYGLFEDGADFLNTETKTFGAIVFGIVYLISAIIIGWKLNNGLVGMGLASPLIILGAWFGLIDLVLIMVVAGVFVIYSIFVIWVKGT